MVLPALGIFGKELVAELGGEAVLGSLFPEEAQLDQKIMEEGVRDPKDIAFIAAAMGGGGFNKRFVAAMKRISQAAKEGRLDESFIRQTAKNFKVEDKIDDLFDFGKAKHEQARTSKTLKNTASTVADEGFEALQKSKKFGKTANLVQDIADQELLDTALEKELADTEAKKTGQRLGAQADEVRGAPKGLLGADPSALPPTIVEEAGLPGKVNPSLGNVEVDPVGKATKAADVVDIEDAAFKVAKSGDAPSGGVFSSIMDAAKKNPKTALAATAIAGLLAKNAFKDDKEVESFDGGIFSKEMLENINKANVEREKRLNLAEGLPNRDFKQFQKREGRTLEREADILLRKLPENMTAEEKREARRLIRERLK